MSSRSYKSNAGVVILQSTSSNSRPSSVYSTGSTASRSTQYTTYSSQSSMDASRSSSSSSRGSGSSDRTFRSGRAGPGSGYATNVREIPQQRGPGIVLFQQAHSGSRATPDERYTHQSTHGSSSRDHSYYK